MGALGDKQHENSFRPQLNHPQRNVWVTLELRSSLGRVRDISLAPEVTVSGKNDVRECGVVHRTTSTADWETDGSLRG